MTVYVYCSLYKQLSMGNSRENAFFPSMIQHAYTFADYIVKRQKHPIKHSQN